MKNKEAKALHSLKSRLNGSAAVSVVKTAVMHLGVGALTALLSQVPFSEGMYPFGLAMIVGVSDRFMIAALAGFIINNWFGDFIAANTVYIAAVGVVAALRWILSGLSRTAYRRSSYLPSLIAASMTVLFTETAVMALSGSLTAQGMLRALAGLGVAGAFSYFYHISFDALRRRRALPEFSSAQKACLALSLASVLMALTPLPVGPFSLGRIAAGAATVFSAYLLAPPFDMVVFGAAGAAVALSDANFAFAAAGLCVAGALSSLFKKRGKPLLCLIYALSACVFAACAPSYAYAITYTTEALSGALVFLLIPLRSRAEAKYDSVSESLGSATAALGGKLGCISASMKDIGTLLDRTVELKDARCNMDKLYNHVAEAQCRKCPMMSRCWVKLYNETTDAWCKLTPVLNSKGIAHVSDLTDEFTDRCVKPAAIIGEINKSYKNYLDDVTHIRSTQLYKAMLKKQFAAIAEMLDSAREELCAVREWDEQKSKRVYDCAARLALPIESASLVYGFARRPIITLTLADAPAPAMVKRLTAGLSLIAGVRLSAPVFDSSAGNTVITYSEQPDFAVKTAVSQLCAEKEICGDVYSVFTDLRGNVHLLLSDGMGTGKSAARDGTVCCAFLKRLLESGFPIKQAAELANTALAMREDRESASTLDALSLDVFTGGATLFKAGAAPTYCLRGNTVEKIGGRTLPVGILEQVICRESKLSLNDGDIVVMTSDGAERPDRPFIEQVLKRLYDCTPEEICKELIDRARQETASGDDVTVMVAKIKRC